MTKEEVSNYTRNIVGGSGNKHTKLVALCWEYHAHSRIKNGHTPFSFGMYLRTVDKHTMETYISSNLIDVTRVCSKEEAIKIINQW